MKRIKWILLLGTLMIISVLSITYINQRDLPIYNEINNVKSSTPNFVKHYLIKGNQKYEADVTEFSLETTKGFYGKKLGRTVGGNDVLSILGQDPNNYVIVTGLMLPAVFYRNVLVKPIDFINDEVDEIQLRDNQGVITEKKTTDDSLIIGEVIDALRKPTYIKIKGDTTVYHITLISPKLKGLGLMVYIVIDKENNVYLEDFITQKPIKAGPLFSKWVNE